MSTVDDQFEAFWRVYPRGRKTAKADARRIFRAIVTGKRRDLKAPAEELIRGAARYAVAMGDGHQFVKKPSTWLNGGCWEDEDMAPPVPVGQVQLSAPDLRNRSLTEALSDRSWAEND